MTQQLTGQSITFPTTSNAEFQALPAANKAAMAVYAGQNMTTGAQAEVYANDFLGFHLSKMPTYSAASAAARANPNDPKAAATLNTVFTGTSLRSMLLNAYGWWTVGTYALYAAIGLTIAALAVLLTLFFEIYRWRTTAAVKVPTQAGPEPAFSQQAAGHGVSQFTEHKS